MAFRYLLLSFVCIAYADDKHLICKQVNDIFSDENPHTSQPTVSEIAALSKKVNALSSAMGKVLTVENCDVFYDGKCFRAILHNTQDVTFAAAQAMCQDIGWELANVYGATHYDMIRDYLREKIPSSRSYNTAWLGMTIDPRTKEMLYSSGSKASHVGLHWYSSHHPSSDPTHTKVGIHINKHPASNNGFFSWPIRADRMRLGSICEM